MALVCCCLGFNGEQLGGLGLGSTCTSLEDFVYSQVCVRVVGGIPWNRVLLSILTWPHRKTWEQIIRIWH